MNNRQQITQDQMEAAIGGVLRKLTYRCKQKGMGTMASNHEISGIIRQEWQEYDDAIHDKLSPEEKIEELKDIAVGALFGIASIESGGVDW